jgi:peroxiredoxin (alkyl hydroperoxide reductase subunit C)
MGVRVGEAAPDLKVDAWVRGAEGPQKVSLADHRGRWIVLVFYPRDFTLIGPSEFAALAALQEELEREDAGVLAASTDSFYSHRAWFESDARLADVRFPIIADTGHRLSRDFGVLLADGATLRATFLIDPEGVVRHMSVNELEVGRNFDEVLRVLQALRTGELCPADWRPGQPTLAASDEQLSRAFPRMDEQRLATLHDRAASVSHTAGEMVIAEGSVADRIFVITAGKAEVVRRRAGGSEEVVSVLGPGEHFGEVGLLLEGRRTASVRALTELELLAFDRDAFHELVSGSDPVRADLTAIARARLAGDAGE